MREERLRLRDLNLICTTLPYTLVVRCDGIFHCRGTGLYRLERFDEAVCGVECVVGALAAICGES